MSWYDDAMRLRDFAAALEDAEYADTDDVLKKPYRFEEEFVIWTNNNSPDETDVADWAAFVAGLNELNTEAEGS